MALHSLLNVRQSLFVRVAPAVTALQRWAVRMIDVFIGFDHDAKDVRLLWLLRNACASHGKLIIPQDKLVHQVR